MPAWRDIRQMLKDGDVAAQPGPAVSETLGEDVIEMGDFRIDLANRTAFMRAQKLLLSWEEFDTLVFLINHPQRLVTRQTTLTTNPATGSPHRTNFLRNLLSLREKLAAAGAGREYLRTEPWIIYRFEPDPSSAT